tara:strand:- start:215 stop:646 length:432 start_codon:yes stop_codon:yes gene_type:complete
MRAILQLPTGLREVFLLNRMAGMTHTEIGLHLGMAPKAVETSLAAALVRLTQAVTASDASSKNRTTKLTCIVAKPNQTQSLCHASAKCPRRAVASETVSRNHVGSNAVKPSQRSAILTPTRAKFTISGGEIAFQTPLKRPETA